MRPVRRIGWLLGVLAAAASCSTAASAQGQRDSGLYIGLFRPDAPGHAQGLMSYRSQPLYASDYNAKCDGTTDDTRALQDVLREAARVRFASLGSGSQVVQLPPGICVIGTTIVVPPQVVLRGLGRGVSEIRAATTWANPNPNVLVRLGDGTGPAFGTRVEMLAINCFNRPGTIGLYSTDIQDESGADYVLIRAFGAVGVLIDSVGVNGGTLEANAYVLKTVEALNGVAGTGVGFLLRSKTTFSPFLMGLTTSNASFPAHRASAGIRVIHGQQTNIYGLGAEFDSAGVDFQGPGQVFGLSCNFCVDALRTNSVGVSGYGITNAGGSNLVADNLNSVTIPVAGNHAQPAYIGGAFPTFVQGLVQGRRALGYSRTVTPSIGAANYFTLNVTNGNAFTVANPTGYAPTPGSAVTQEWGIDFFNSSGGAMGAVTFGAAYKMSGAFAAPAAGNHRIYRFYWDGFFWRELSRSPVDQVNLRRPVTRDSLRRAA